MLTDPVGSVDWCCEVILWTETAVRNGSMEVKSNDGLRSERSEDELLKKVWRNLNENMFAQKHVGSASEAM